VLAMVVLGGMGHIPGVILGAVLLTALGTAAQPGRRYSRRCLAKC
jgi:ABC-type branched-subunit amino acid transport system permease subunit